jgi:hypothetical protein
MELQRALGSILDTNQTTVADKDNFKPLIGSTVKALKGFLMLIFA